MNEQDIQDNQDIQAMIERARALATEAHAGQTRRNGDPYITHPQRVASRCEGLAAVAGWLHDTVEDTAITLDTLREAGFPEAVVEAVDRLSRRDGETYAQFTQRCGQDTLARAVKLADLTDNLSDLPPGKQRDKYELAELYLESLA